MKLKSRQRIKSYDHVTTLSPNLDIFFQMVGNRRMKKRERDFVLFFSLLLSHYFLNNSNLIMADKCILSLKNMSKIDREKVKGAKIKCPKFYCFYVGSTPSIYYF